jgi:hypothetical protein
MSPTYANVADVCQHHVSFGSSAGSFGRSLCVRSRDPADPRCPHEGDRLLARAAHAAGNDRRETPCRLRRQSTIWTLTSPPDTSPSQGSCGDVSKTELTRAAHCCRPPSAWPPRTRCQRRQRCMPLKCSCKAATPGMSSPSPIRSSGDPTEKGPGREPGQRRPNGACGTARGVGRSGHADAGNYWTRKHPL